MGALIAGAKYPRRVRRAPEGGAEGSAGVGGRDHPVHRRAAHGRRRGQGRRRDGRGQPAQADAGARRTALHRRHHARRIPQAHRKGRRARAPLPAGAGGPAVGRGHHLDPARAARSATKCITACASRTRRWWRRRCCPTATSRTASCRTRRSTWWTKRRRSCAPRSIPCRRSWTRSRRRIMQLEIEREALQQGEGCGVEGAAGEAGEGTGRPARRSRTRCRARWQAEKEAVQRLRALREQIEQTKIEIEQAERQYDLNRAAELKYGKLAELEKQLAGGRRAAREAAGRTADQGRSGRGGHRRSRQPLDRRAGDQAAGRRDAEAAAPGRRAAPARDRPGRGGDGGGRGRDPRALRA